MLRNAYLNAMQGLEAGLKVRDIAVFGLVDCGPGDRVGIVRARVDPYDFDNVPVSNGQIIGVVEGIKTLDRDALAKDVMRPLDESMLVAGSSSLLSFLPHIGDYEYRLVVDDGGIRGVVTPSDVVQLPVRLLVFTLLVHLEETMRNLIRYRVGEDQDRILGALDPSSRGRIEKLLGRHARAGLNPSPLDVTGFIDKANLVFDLQLVEAGPETRQLFVEFRDLRNKVDHVQDYAETREQLSRFLILVSSLRTWIDRLTDEFPLDALEVPGRRRPPAG